MTAAFLETLAVAALAASIAVLLVMLVRPKLRALFGARTAYAFWAIVPAAALASLIPSREVITEIALPAIEPATAVPVDAAPVAPVTSLPTNALPLTPVPDEALVSGPAAAQAAATGFTLPDTLTLLLVLWALGAAFMLARLVYRQRKFMSDHAGTGAPLHIADSPNVGPVAVGLLRPQIIVPTDFRTRYSKLERRLIVAHERAHITAGDMRFNLIAALLDVIFWFNPLIKMAIARFRMDQELACDARVMKRFGAHRKAYGEALLKTQFLGTDAPLACAWSSKTLKARLEALTGAAPTPIRRLLGGILVAAAVSGAAAAAWAAFPEEKTVYVTETTATVTQDKAPQEKVTGEKATGEKEFGEKPGTPQERKFYSRKLTLESEGEDGSRYTLRADGVTRLEIGEDNSVVNLEADQIVVSNDTHARKAKMAELEKKLAEAQRQLEEIEVARAAGKPETDERGFALAALEIRQKIEAIQSERLTLEKRALAEELAATREALVAAKRQEGLDADEAKARAYEQELAAKRAVELAEFAKRKEIEEHAQAYKESQRNARAKHIMDSLIYQVHALLRLSEGKDDALKQEIEARVKELEAEVKELMEARDTNDQEKLSALLREHNEEIMADTARRINRLFGKEVIGPKITDRSEAQDSQFEERDADFEFAFGHTGSEPLVKTNALYKAAARTLAEVDPGLKTTVDPEDPRSAAYEAMGSALVRAVQRGNMRDIKGLIEGGADVNYIERGDGTPLLEAARRGNHEAVRLLLDAGADIDKFAPGDGTALLVAAGRGRADIATLLIEAGADVNAPAPGDGNPLIAAARRGQKDMVKLLLDAGADPNAYVRGDETPLIGAAASNQRDIARMLIAAGADVNLAVDSGNKHGREHLRTPVGQAKRRGHDRMVKMLLENGAKDVPKED